jgi:hypothetical protein
MVLIGKSISEDFLIFAYYMKIKLTLELTLGNHYKEYKHHYTERERERERERENTSKFWIHPSGGFLEWSPGTLMMTNLSGGFSCFKSAVPPCTSCTRKPQLLIGLIWPDLAR